MLSLSCPLGLGEERSPSRVIKTLRDTIRYLFLYRSTIQRRDMTLIGYIKNII
uniref:Uncharacterized protein n=1 Tax=Arundo donax TaxID=35708 RepID=A0A0A9DA88_ARUDO